MEADLFEWVGQVARSLCRDDHGEMHVRSHRYGTKVWFGSDKPHPSHFEAQVIGRQHVDGKQGLVVEIGWHGEDRSEDANQQMLHALVSQERTWRESLGPEPEAGEFFNATKWRRLSETWIDPDLSVDGLDVEIGARLADYIDALQPALNDLMGARAERDANS